MAKRLVVPIVADSTAFKRGLRESETAAKQFEGKIKGTTSHVRTHILGIATAFVGVGGLVEGLGVAINAAEDLEKSTRSLDAQLKANHESLKAIQPQLAGVESNMAKLGFTNSETEQAFTRLDRASGSSATALKYLGVTADLARAKHIDLSAAALIVGKVMDGNVGILNRQGIAIAKGTSATDALAIAQKKLAGQAAANTTPMEKFHATLTNIEAIIGEQLLPTINKYVDKLSEWFSKSQNQKRITDDVKKAVEFLQQVIDVLKTSVMNIKAAFDKFSDAVGGNKRAIELLVGAFAAFKAASFLGTLATVAKSVGLIGTAASVEAGQVGVLRAALLGLGGPAVIAALAASAAGVGAILFMRGQAKHLSGGAGNFTSNGTPYAVGGGRVAGRYTGPGSGVNPLDGVTGNNSPRDPMRGASAGHITATMSAGQVRALVMKAGGSAAEANYLAAISGKESGRNSTALNDSLSTHDYSVGLFQINFRDMQNRWMRGGQSAAAALRKDPLAQAKYALGLLHSQGPSAWSTNTPAIQALLGGGGGGSLPGDAASQAAAEKAKTAAEKRAAAAAEAAASAAYRSWKENYFTPLDNEYKNDLLITDESKRLNKLQALHAKLAIDRKTASGKERQDIFNEETKVAGKIQSLRQKMANAHKALIAKEHAAYVKGLQDDLATAQTSLSRQQAVFDRAWSRIAAKITGAFNKATQAGLAAIQAKYGAATPEEQARDSFQAQLKAAQDAADLGSAQNDLIAAQLAGDPEGVRQAQAHLGDVQNAQKLSDLQDAADKSRTIANAASDKEQADYQAARDDQLQNLNDWLDDQKTALENGTETWAQFWQAAFSDAPAKYAPDAVSSLQGVIDQMQRIKDLQDKINNATGGGGGSGTVTLPGGLTVPAGVIGHGFGGSFAAGGVVPGSLGQPMMILAHGGERVIPNGGGGGHTFNISFPQYVGSRDELARTLRDELVTLGRREPNIFGGFA